MSAGEAGDRLRRAEAREIRTSSKRSGILALPRKTKAHTLQEQLAEVQVFVERELPDLWVQTGLAKLKQVEGLPVVGDAIKVFRGKDARPAGSTARATPRPVLESALRRLNLEPTRLDAEPMENPFMPHKPMGRAVDLLGREAPERKRLLPPLRRAA